MTEEDEFLHNKDVKEFIEKTFKEDRAGKHVTKHIFEQFVGIEEV